VEQVGCASCATRLEQPKSSAAQLTGSATRIAGLKNDAGRNSVRFNLTAVNDGFMESGYTSSRRLIKRLALSTQNIKALTKQINNHLQSCMGWCELQDPNKAFKALGRSEDLLSQLYLAVLNHSKATLTAPKP